MHPALHCPVSADLQPQSHHFPRQIKPLGDALHRASAGPETGLQGGGMEVLVNHLVSGSGKTRLHVNEGSRLKPLSLTYFLLIC